jgi:hypothetical protein
VRRRGDDVGGAVLEQNLCQVTAKAFGLLERTDAGAAQLDAAVRAAGEGAQQELRAVFALDHLGQSADRRGAAGFESGEQSALCGYAGSGVWVVQRCQGLNQVGAVLTALDGKGALSRSREHL